jgi:hypothetical protein
VTEVAESWDCGNGTTRYIQIETGTEERERQRDRQRDRDKGLCGFVTAKQSLSEEPKELRSEKSPDCKAGCNSDLDRVPECFNLCQRNL